VELIRHVKYINVFQLSKHMLFPTLAGATEIDLKPDSKQNEITGNAVWLI